jgi:hypothetical protein
MSDSVSGRAPAISVGLPIDLRRLLVADAPVRPMAYNRVHLPDYVLGFSRSELSDEAFRSSCRILIAHRPRSYGRLASLAA